MYRQGIVSIQQCIQLLYSMPQPQTGFVHIMPRQYAHMRTGIIQHISWSKTITISKSRSPIRPANSMQSFVHPAITKIAVAKRLLCSRCHRPVRTLIRPSYGPSRPLATTHLHGFKSSQAFVTGNDTFAVCCCLVSYHF